MKNLYLFFKGVFFINILFASQMPLQAQVSFGKPEKINGQWEFYPEDNPDENGISRNRGVAQIEIRLPDENGIPAILADNQLTCLVEGPGKLLDLEAGNNTDMGNYRDNIQRTYKGRV